MRNDLTDLAVDWGFIGARWKRIFFGMTIGFAIAAVAFSLTPPLWKASALVQIGQVVGTSPIQIESVDIVAQEIIQPSFIKAAIERPDSYDILKELLTPQNMSKWRLQGNIMSPDSIVVTAHAPSSLLAKKLVESVVANLVNKDAALVEPRVRFARELLSSLQSRAAGEEKRAGETSKILIEEQNKGANEQDTSSAFMSRVIKNDVLDRDRQLALLAIEATTAPNLRLTQMIGDVEVSDEPDFPNPSHFAALGLLLGTAISAALLWKCARQN